MFFRSPFVSTIASILLRIESVYIIMQFLNSLQWNIVPFFYQTTCHLLQRMLEEEIYFSFSFPKLPIVVRYLNQVIVLARKNVEIHFDAVQIQIELF